MRIWLTTDTHLGHDKIIESCGRPENHEEIILKELSLIPKDCLLIHLGDVCIGNDRHWHQEIFNATKHCRRRILVRGNHDH